MSVAYEPRPFLHEGSYPNIGDDDNNDREPGPDTSEDHFPDADGLANFNPPPTMLEEERALIRDESPAAPEAAPLDLPVAKPASPPSMVELEKSAAKAATPHLATSKSPTPPLTTSGRMKAMAIPKPEREISKHADGKFYCSFPGCTEEKQMFSRKCEWSKHMDKHERPYRCAVGGCEKLPGFTYSGGLLRHEREVHGKHGGPKTTVNCPHLNCKRHTGKGFSRQENLNEHLRRVHTNDGTAQVEDAALSDDESEKTGSKKRKRPAAFNKDPAEQIAELRAEIKRSRKENQELRAQLDRQEQHHLAIMAQIAELQDFRHNSMNAQAATML